MTQLSSTHSPNPTTTTTPIAAAAHIRQAPPPAPHTPARRVLQGAPWFPPTQQHAPATAAAPLPPGSAAAQQWQLAHAIAAAGYGFQHAGQQAGVLLPGGWPPAGPAYPSAALHRAAVAPRGEAVADSTAGTPSAGTGCQALWPQLHPHHHPATSALASAAALAAVHAAQEAAAAEANAAAAAAAAAASPYSPAAMDPSGAQDGLSLPLEQVSLASRLQTGRASPVLLPASPSLATAALLYAAPSVTPGLLVQRKPY